MTCLIGIDNGLTITKAVVFDVDGTPLATARRRLAQDLPRPRFVERDMEALWRATAAAIREALALSGRPPSDVAAIAATAHGDGLYLLDRRQQPLGPGILSLDSRAGAVADAWNAGDVGARALARTGQEPHASAPSAILGWIARHDPERLAAIGTILACKDWLRFRLSGSLGTDRTEASTSFTEVRSQAFDPEALAIYGLSDLFPALPAVAHPAARVGGVTRAAAEATGLLEGTPVAAGLHDVTASALGVGGHEPDWLTMVVGTYSINEVVTTAPAVDARWFCRAAIEPGEWNAMAISPASTANYDWFLDQFCRAERAIADAGGAPVHEQLAGELAAALDKPSDILFHPFLFGSPHGSTASAGFFGLHGWHDRGDLLKAVLEGIVFNHRTHVDDLRSAFPVKGLRLAGGGSRNPALSQMFADALGLPVEVSATDEAAAWGAALCAGACVGIFASPREGARATTRVLRRHVPDAARGAALDARYRLYGDLSRAMAPHWHAIEALAASSRGDA